MMPVGLSSTLTGSGERVRFALVMMTYDIGVKDYAHTHEADVLSALDDVLFVDGCSAFVNPMTRAEIEAQAFVTFNALYATSGGAADAVFATQLFVTKCEEMPPAGVPSYPSYP